MPVITGTDGSDVLTGGPGDDTISGGPASDTLRGGAGNDRLIGYSLDDGPNLLEGEEGNDTLAGGNAGDRLLGGQGNDSLYGGLGSDSLSGGEGADTLDGGHGSDLVDGGPGDDILQDTTDGADTLLGGDGNDWISIVHGPGSPPTPGRPVFEGPPLRLPVLMEGGNGADTLVLSTSAVIPLSGNVLIFTAPLTATVRAGAGSDMVFVSGAPSGVIDLGEGDDLLSVQISDGSLLVVLGPGADGVTFGVSSVGAKPIVEIADFQPGPGGDWLQLRGWEGLHNGVVGAGGLGSGYLRLREDGPDTIIDVDADGGGDSFQAAVRLRGVTAGQLTADNLPGLAVNGMEPVGRQILIGDAPTTAFGQGFGILGTEGADTISAAARELSVAIFGGGGNDVIQGGPGGSYIDGGAGNNLIYGGAGRDTILMEEGDDTVHGGAGDDRIGDFGGQNYLRGDEGDDEINGGSGFDDANGNQGNDTIHGNGGDDYAVGGKDNDLLFGDAGNDIVWGNLGDDTCHGGDGDDQVRGGQGNDSLSGGNGNDFVSGDRGDDTISGGAGADIFHSSQDAGLDRVLDFSVAEGDRVQLDPGTIYSVSQVGADTVISMGGANQVILVGVSLSSLAPSSIFLG